MRTWLEIAVYGENKGLELLLLRWHKVTKVCLKSLNNFAFTAKMLVNCRNPYYIISEKEGICTLKLNTA